MQPFGGAASGGVADEDVVLDFGAETAADRKFHHPVVVLFHLLFRSLAFIVFLFANVIFSQSKAFITAFAFIILFLCSDFWTVKNVSGRLLVGLRWWNYVDDLGESHWVFEQAKPPPTGSSSRKYSPHEVRIFWLSLVAFPVLWVVFFFLNIFNLRWLMITILGLGLNGANLYGYLRCKFGAHARIRDAATKFVGQKLMENVLATTASRGDATAASHARTGSEDRRRTDPRRAVPTMDGEIETI